jgi:activator of HSP90 ATPase
METKTIQQTATFGATPMDVYEMLMDSKKQLNHFVCRASSMETKTIQQTATFGATPMDVYEMLMDSKKHASLSDEPAKISRKVGGRFTAWGTHISGFNLALKPRQKIVQAWRALDWWPDHYSIAIFDLKEVKAGTKLDFTQIGVPPRRYDGHCRGWTQTYWIPMKEILEQGSTSGQTRKNVEAARQRIRTGNL